MEDQSKLKLVLQLGTIFNSNETWGSNISSTFIKTVNELNLYALPNDISGSIPDYWRLKLVQEMTNENKEEYDVNQEANTFFSNLVTTKIQESQTLITNYALSYFSNGSFSTFIKIFARYVITLNYEDEDIINDLVIKYTIASVLLQNYVAEENIQKIQSKYDKYDYNVYIFYIKFFLKKFNGIGEVIEKIKSNISQNTFDTLVDEKDLSLLISLALSFNYEPSISETILPNKELFISDAAINHPEQYRHWLMLYNCQFEDALNYYNTKLKQQGMKIDYIKVYFKVLDDMVHEWIIKEIMSLSSKTSIDYWKGLLKITDDWEISKLITKIIGKYQLRWVTDDIDRIVLKKEDNEMDEMLKTMWSVSRKNLMKTINYFAKNNIHGYVNKTLNHPNIQVQQWEDWKLHDWIEQNNMGGAHWMRQMEHMDLD